MDLITRMSIGGAAPSVDGLTEGDLTLTVIKSRECVERTMDAFEERLVRIRSSYVPSAQAGEVGAALRQALADLDRLDALFERGDKEIERLVREMTPPRREFSFAEILEAREKLSELDDDALRVHRRNQPGDGRRLGRARAGSRAILVAIRPAAARDPARRG